MAGMNARAQLLAAQLSNLIFIGWIPSVQTLVLSSQNAIQFRGLDYAAENCASWSTGEVPINVVDNQVYCLVYTLCSSTQLATLRRSVPVVVQPVEHKRSRISRPHQGF